MKNMVNNKCQVFTPDKNVEELLNAVGYTENLYDKKVIENSCGKGNILKEIVKRYIKDAINKNKTSSEIKEGLEKNIYGLEIDKLCCNECIRTLNYISQKYQILDVKWNISNSNFLKENIKNKFDYVIGNPPYIKYEDLNIETRLNLKENFYSCKKGKFDYYYAFIEAGLISLKENGKLAYLIPSNMFKNVFAQEIRTIILPNITKIIDYTTQKIFNKVSVSSAIIICSKDVFSNNIEYQDIVNKNKYNINKSTLKNKWIFSISNKNSKRRFSDYFKAANSICTSSNSIYILKKFSENKDYINCDSFKIEKQLIRTAISPRSLRYKKPELILFPYKYNEKNELVRYTSKEFEKQFPEATNYLRYYTEKSNNEKLIKKAEWFEYGRTQALNHLNQDKLLISRIVTNKVNVYELGKEQIPYSGIYIIQKKELPLKMAKEILENNNFYNYVKEIGINVSGNSFRITSNDLNNYMF